MKNLIIVTILSILAVSCKPSIQPQLQEGPALSWEDTTATVDSVSTITLTENVVPIQITIDGSTVIISSGNVNTTYTVEADKVLVNRTEAGLVEYIQINNDILFKENAPAGVNHNYRYLDANQIEIIKGNTINGILLDHKITKKQLYKCNPFLHKRGLQIGDVLNLDCN